MDEIEQKLSGVLNFSEISNDPFSLIILLGVSTIIGLLLLLKLLFMSMKKADNLRLKEFYDSLPK